MVKALFQLQANPTAEGAFFCQQEVKKSIQGRYLHEDCRRFDYRQKSFAIEIGSKSRTAAQKIHFPDLMVFQQAAAGVTEKEHRIVEAGNDLESKYNRLEATDTRRCFATVTLRGNELVRIVAATLVARWHQSWPEVVFSVDPAVLA